MNTEQTEQRMLQISRERLMAFVRTMIGATQASENGTHPLPPARWDSVVRGALEGIGKRVALNPQPLPPRYAFLVAVAQTVISRAQMLQELTDAMPIQGGKNGGIDVGGYTSRLTDDFCGTGFRLTYPLPGPRPKWFASELDGIDLVVMATKFEEAAKETFNPQLRQNLADASAKLVEAGCSKMQSVTGASYARTTSRLQSNAVPAAGKARTTASLQTNAVPAGYASTPSSLRSDSVPAAGFVSTASNPRTKAAPSTDGSHPERVRTFGSLD